MWSWALRSPMNHSHGCQPDSSRGDHSQSSSRTSLWGWSPVAPGVTFPWSSVGQVSLPPEAIDLVSRFTLQDGYTIRRALDVRKEDVEEREAGEIGQDDLVKLRQMLRGNL